MKKMFFILIGALTFCIVAIIGTDIAYRFIMDVRGYHVQSSIDPVAEIAIEKRDAKECWKWRPGIFLGPPPSELRAWCVYETAKQLQDPEVCKMLMPSEYGLSCIGEIWGTLIDLSNCHWMEENAIRCFLGVELKPEITRCDVDPLVGQGKEECWHRQAFNAKKAENCAKITDQILRSVCEVRIETWNKYPELRSSVYFGGA